MNAPSSRKGVSLGLLWCLCGAALVVLLAATIRSESFWIDELSSAYVVATPEWSVFSDRLAEMGSEAQMPLYMAWLWAWARLFGVGEWALRAANLPWAILAVAAWIGLLRRRTTTWWTVPILLAPMVCYYMNEARPYLMTFSTGMLALWGVEMMCTRVKVRDIHAGAVALTAGVGLCAGASMLNLFLVPALMTYVVMRWPGNASGGLSDFVRMHRMTLVGLFTVIVFMVCYFAFTLIQGHGGQRTPFSAINAAYSVYEMLGFGGLGAPRILLRELSSKEVLSRYGGTLALGLVVWGGVGWSFWRARREILHESACRAALSGWAVGVLGLMGAAVCFKASLWGRHFMAVLPLFAWGVVCALEAARARTRVVGSIAVWALVALFMLSSLRQRVLDEYGKDPLREAVRELAIIGRQNPDTPVVVLAGTLALWYYNTENIAMIPVVRWPEARARRWQNIHREYFLLVHRADNLDPAGVWSGNLGKPGTKLVWQRGNARIFRIRRDSSGEGN